MAIVFDGKLLAKKIEEEIKIKVAGMSRKPKLVTIYDPSNKGSAMYTKVKAAKAEELGIEFQAITETQVFEELNKDEAVGGIMVQLPIDNSKDLIDSIDPKKDVDGLRNDSTFLPATVKAVIAILDEANIDLSKLRVLVVGNEGEVGRRLELTLGKECTVFGIDKRNFDSEQIKRADVVISCTGQAGLIKPEMVKENVICIDVGYPRGDFAPEVVEKAAFFTPVPGGVGPVTVAMLFANLVEI